LRGKLAKNHISRHFSHFFVFLAIIWTLFVLLDTDDRYVIVEDMAGRLLVGLRQYNSAAVTLCGRKFVPFFSFLHLFGYYQT
jgi:hypothetical protein